MLWKTSLIATVGVLVSACAQTVVDTYCTSYTPVAYSATKDTPETVRQVQENNAVWRKLCR